MLAWGAMTRLFDRAQIPSAPDLRFERALWQTGVLRVAGLDEAGRGAWAGPVSAGVVIFMPDETLPIRLHHVRDSKQMTPAARDFWAQEIRACAVGWGVGLASHAEIDALGIISATRLAMLRALQQAEMHADHLLIDALRLPELAIPQTALIKGDARSLSIAAASVLAKTTRDAQMVAYDALYPQYGFARHKGYGTAAHWAALQQCGPCQIHRFSFQPLKVWNET